MIREGLDELQLSQVRIAMERGLTEEQLGQLIDQGLSPKKMSELIDLAVLINANQ